MELKIILHGAAAQFKFYLIIIKNAVFFRLFHQQLLLIFHQIDKIHILFHRAESYGHIRKRLRLYGNSETLCLITEKCADINLLVICCHFMRAPSHSLPYLPRLYRRQAASSRFYIAVSYLHSILSFPISQQGIKFSLNFTNLMCIFVLYFDCPSCF